MEPPTIMDKFLQKATTSKDAFRQKAANKPIIEKLRDLDTLRDAAILFKTARITKPDKSHSPGILPPMSADLLNTLQTRFDKHPSRHPNLDWPTVEARLKANPEKLQSLHQMEETGGEPDVVLLDPQSDRITFVDCSKESPKHRRSLCYDPAALDSRKENKPRNSAVQMAEEMGIELLTEDQYRALQTHGPFDTKTSSWVATPESLRALGGALFGDWRFGRVFIYHNGAESYYAARGFRGLLEL